MKPIELGNFKVGMTTSYNEWIDSFNEKLEGSDYIYDEVCDHFARKQPIYMTSPMSIFGTHEFTSKTILVKDQKYLDMFSDSGPLYQIFKVLVDDNDSEKNVERVYFDSVNFAHKYGLWYPQKEQIVLKIGVEV